MTNAEITARLNTLNGYKLILSNILELSESVYQTLLGSGYSSWHFTNSIDIQPNQYYKSSIAFDALNNIYSKIMGGNTSYIESTNNLLESQSNNFLTFKIVGGNIDLYRLQYQHVVIQRNNEGIYESSSLFSMFSASITPHLADSYPYFYAFDYIPKNPFFYGFTQKFTFSNNDSQLQVKGKILNYNPAKIETYNLVQRNMTIDNSVYTLNEMFNPTSQDRNMLFGAQQQLLEIGYCIAGLGGGIDIYNERKSKITQNETALKAIILDYIHNGLDIQNTTLLNNATTTIPLYGIFFNQLFEWIDSEISALTNTTTVRVDWQNRLNILNGDLSIQNDIAETLGLEKTLGVIEYGGDIDYAFMEWCVHFTDGLAHPENLSAIAESLQIGTNQFISKAELKAKLKMANIEHFMVYSTKTVSYSISTSSTDPTTGDTTYSSTSFTDTIQVGYINKNIFGLSSAKFAKAMDHCMSFNSHWNERCSFDKIVGFVLVVVGMFTQNVYITPIGITMMVIKMIATIFLMSGHGSDRDKMWAQIALVVTLSYDVAQGWGATTYKDANGNIITKTAAEVMWSNANLSMQLGNGVFGVYSSYKQNQWQDENDSAKAQMDKMNQDLAKLNDEITKFTYNDFYNPYDSLYTVGLIDYDKFYTS